MRLRSAVLVLAVCGVLAPVRADEAKTADVNKYLPADAGFYVHVNVRQFLAAPVIRKAIPMAVSKFEKQIGFGLQLAMAAAPNAGNVSEDQLKAVLEGMKDENTIAQAFDAAKDSVTHVVLAGHP